MLSESERYERACEGKRTFWSKAQAKRTLKREAATHGGDWLQIYKCPWCGNYHAGHHRAKPLDPKPPSEPEQPAPTSKTAQRYPTPEAKQFRNWKDKRRKLQRALEAETDPERIEQLKTSIANYDEKIADAKAGV